MDLRCRLLERTMLQNVLEEYDIIPSTNDLHLLHSTLSTRPRRGTFEETHSNVLSKALNRVVLNKTFNKEEFGKHELLLCESFCLLWQDTMPSDKWKQLGKSEEFNQGICAAMLLDLIASDKIVFVEDKRFLGFKESHCFDHYYIDVIDSEITPTFIDTVLLKRLLSSSSQRQNPRDVLLLAKSYGCAKHTLRNIQSRGIIGQAERIHTFSSSSNTHNSIYYGTVYKFKQYIRMIALEEKPPDSYMLSLLTLSLVGGGGGGGSFIHTILQEQLNSKQYRIARENLKVIVRTQATCLNSPKFVRKKFSQDVKT